MDHKDDEKIVWLNLLTFYPTPKAIKNLDKDDDMSYLKKHF